MAVVVKSADKLMLTERCMGMGEYRYDKLHYLAKWKHSMCCLYAAKEHDGLGEGDFCRFRYQSWISLHTRTLTACFGSWQPNEDASDRWCGESLYSQKPSLVCYFSLFCGIPLASSAHQGKLNWVEKGTGRGKRSISTHNLHHHHHQPHYHSL